MISSIVCYKLIRFCVFALRLLSTCTQQVLISTSTNVQNGLVFMFDKTISPQMKNGTDRADESGTLHESLVCAVRDLARRLQDTLAATLCAAARVAFAAQTSGCAYNIGLKPNCSTFSDSAAAAARIATTVLIAFFASRHDAPFRFDCSAPFVCNTL